MSAANAMLRHRYGAHHQPMQYGRRTGIGPSSSDLGDIVATEMFGEDDPFDPSSVPEFDQQPLFQPQPGAPGPAIPASVQGAVATFIAQVKNAWPYPVSFDVRGGQDAAGRGYAQLTIDAHDPHNFLQRSASWALQAAGSGVSVSAVPSPTKKGQVVLVFSQGPVPKPIPPTAPKGSLTP